MEDIPELNEKGGSLGRTLIPRTLILLAEFAAVYALYYGYALIATAEIPLHILTLILIVIDRVVDGVRAAFDRNRDRS